MKLFGGGSVINGAYPILFTYIVDPNVSSSRLQSLDIILLYLDGFGLKWVSWVVKFLDKPQWRAVPPYKRGFSFCQFLSVLVSMLLSASVEIFIISRMWDALVIIKFFSFTSFKHILKFSWNRLKMLKKLNKPESFCFVKKKCILEKLNPWTCADSSTETNFF